MLDNSSTALSLYESGQLETGDAIPPSEVPRLIKEGKVKVYPFLGTCYISFNTVKPPFDNPKVRQAFTLAMDRAAITDKLLRGGQQPALAFVPQGLADANVTEDFRGKAGSLLQGQCCDQLREPCWRRPDFRKDGDSLRLPSFITPANQTKSSRKPCRKCGKRTWAYRLPWPIRNGKFILTPWINISFWSHVRAGAAIIRPEAAQWGRRRWC